MTLGNSWGQSLLVVLAGHEGGAWLSGRFFASAWCKVAYTTSGISPKGLSGCRVDLQERGACACLPALPAARALCRPCALLEMPSCVAPRGMGCNGAPAAGGAPWHGAHSSSRWACSDVQSACAVALTSGECQCGWKVRGCLFIQTCNLPVGLTCGCPGPHAAGAAPLGSRPVIIVPGCYLRAQLLAPEGTQAPRLALASQPARLP